MRDFAAAGTVCTQVENTPLWAEGSGGSIDELIGGRCGVHEVLNDIRLAIDVPHDARISFQVPETIVTIPVETCRIEDIGIAWLNRGDEFDRFRQ